MALMRLKLDYQRVGVTDRTYTVNFDFRMETSNYQTVGLDIANGLKNVMTTIQQIQKITWYDVLIRSTKRYSNKTKGLVTVYYASAGIPRYTQAVAYTGVLAAGGNRTVLGMGMYFASYDSAGGRSGKFLVRGGITEDHIVDTNLSAWPIPQAFINAVATNCGTTASWGKYFGSGVNTQDKMVNIHVSKTGVGSYYFINSIQAKRIKQYRSVQPGIS